MFDVTSIANSSSARRETLFANFHRTYVHIRLACLPMAVCATTRTHKLASARARVHARTYALGYLVEAAGEENMHLLYGWGRSRVFKSPETYARLEERCVPSSSPLLSSSPFFLRASRSFDIVFSMPFESFLEGTMADNHGQRRYPTTYTP